MSIKRLHDNAARQCIKRVGLLAAFINLRGLREVGHSGV